MVFIFLLKEEELIMLIMTSKLLRKFIITQNCAIILRLSFKYTENTKSVTIREFIGDSIILSVAKAINRHKLIGSLDLRTLHVVSHAACACEYVQNR